MKINRIIVLLGFILLTGCSSTMPNLGVTNGKLTECPSSPNCVSSQAQDDKHFIEPLTLLGSQSMAHDRLVDLLTKEKRVKIVVDKADYIHAEFTSFVFRFVDDVEFYILDEKEGSTLIHIRSASRVGHSDMGVNRKRMEAIRSKLQP